MKTIAVLPTILMVSAVSTNADILRGLETQPCSLYDNPQDLVPQSWEVLQILQSSETSALKCVDHIDPVERKLQSTHDIVEKTSKVLDLVDKNSDKITKSVNKISDSVNKVANIAQRIPKIGKLVKIGARIFDSVANAMTKVTKQVDTLKDGVDKLEDVLSKAVDATGSIKSNYETAASRMAKAAKVQDGVIRCVSATKQNCDDDKALEVISSNVKSPFEVGYKAIDVCDESFSRVIEVISRVESALSKLKLEAVQKALQALESKLGPVIRDFEKIVKTVADKISEGYCCATPFPIQQLGELASQVIDVATCPIDGLIAEVEKSLANVVMSVSADIHNLFLEQVRPVVKLLQDLHDDTTFTITVIDQYTVEDACTLSPPSFSSETFSLIDEDILNKIPTKMEKQDVVKFDVGSSIANACKESTSALGKVSKESCCVEFKGNIKNGDFCDPTGSVPYKHCSMCEGGVNEFWWSKGHHACGKEPCMKDGVLCGLGTTCNRCCNKQSYWYGKALTACGQEPCWKKGTKCGEGTSCKRCCKGASYKFPNLWSNCK